MIYVFDQKPALEDIEHFGVKGMRWGVRTNKSTSSSSKSSSRSSSKKKKVATAAVAIGAVAAASILASRGSQDFRTVYGAVRNQQPVFSTRNGYGTIVNRGKSGQTPRASAFRTARKLSSAGRRGQVVDTNLIDGTYRILMNRSIRDLR